MAQSTLITETSPLLHDANCVYCHTDLELNDLVIVCDKCGAPHHFDCWKESGNRCGTFGCGGSYATPPSNLPRPDIIIPVEPEINLSTAEPEPTHQWTTAEYIKVVGFHILAVVVLFGMLFLDREELPVTRLYGHDDPINSVSWSPDGSQLASGADDRTIIIWDVENPDTKLVLKGHAADVNSVEWSPDGSKIASGGDDETVRIWDAATGAELKRFEKHRQRVNSISWSPDGSRIASGSWDRTVRVWHVDKDEEVAVLAGHMHTIWDVSWSPDGSKIASASGDKTVRIWDAVSGASVNILSGHTGIVWSVSWSPHSNAVASSSQDGTVRIWDMRSDAESGMVAYTTRYRESNTRNVQWSPDGTQIVVENSNLVFDAENGWSSQQFVEGDFFFRKSGQWSPDGNLIAVGHRINGDYQIEIWDVSSE